jgi:hypothetical protein
MRSGALPRIEDEADAAYAGRPAGPREALRRSRQDGWLAHVLLVSYRVSEAPISAFRRLRFRYTLLSHYQSSME